MDTHRKIVAAGVVTMLLMTGFVVIVNESGEDHEVDALPVEGWAFLAGVGFGILLEHYILGPIFSDDDEDTAREGETNTVSTFLNTGVADYTQYLSQYAMMWPLTNEHWIRQAELAATSLWEPGTSYDSTWSSKVLEASGVYFNMGQTVDNITSQINAHWGQLNGRIALWSDGKYSEVYGNDKMKMELVLQSVSAERVLSASAGEKFDIRTGVVLEVDGNNNRAWLSGGDLYSSVYTTIYNDYHSYDLEPGWNHLPDTTEFDAGIYTFGRTDGAVFCGNIVPISGQNAASGVAGLVADVNGEYAVITVSQMQAGESQYKPDCDVTDGNRDYDSIFIRISPEEADNGQSVDITAALARFQMMLNTMKSTIPQINTSAATVWEIFTAAGESNPFITTLMVPNTYNNMQLTQEQKQLITSLALEQLYQYWKDNGTDVMKDGYDMTFDSLSLYCRGDVVIKDYTLPGESQSRQVEYKDVIFTPLFYRDTSLSIDGTNTIDDYGFVVIWGKGQSLDSFDSSDPEYAEIIFIGDGAELDIASMKYDGRYVSDVNLEAANINDLPPDTVDLPGPVYTDPDNDLDQVIRMAFVILGVLVMVAGVMSRSYIWLVVGLVIIVLGFLVAEPLEELCEKLWDWRVTL